MEPDFFLRMSEAVIGLCAMVLIISIMGIIGDDSQFIYERNEHKK
jgi:hypothetical protein